MPRELETLLTSRDKEWLAEMERAMQPKPMVSAKVYCDMVDANDYTTRQNYLLRMQRQRLVKIARWQADALRTLWLMLKILGASVTALLLAAWLRA